MLKKPGYIAKYFFNAPDTAEECPDDLNLVRIGLNNHDNTVGNDRTSLLCYNRGVYYVDIVETINWNSSNQNSI